MNRTATAHGLDGTLVEPDWPPLTLPELRAVLDKFPDSGEPIEILSSSPRPFSAASVVRTLRQKLFIKRHARILRDAESLRVEHRFMRHLSQNNIAVPRVLATLDGETALEIDQWTYEVHAIPPGIDLYQDAISWTPFRSIQHARSAGEMLARLHLAAQDYDAPPRKPRPLVASFSIFAAQNPDQVLQQYLAARPVLEHDAQTRQDSAQALDLLRPFHDELKPLLPSLAPLWTHNDLHASNLFWSDAGANAHPTSVIDFGLADRTNAIYDLAQAIERNIVEWLTLMRDPIRGEVAVHLDQLWAFLDGYQHVRPLSRAEAAALSPMLALGHAEFALTEAHYFLQILHSSQKARIATSSYLVNHAQWFRGPGRQKLLDPLRQWAAAREQQAVRA